MEVPLYTVKQDAERTLVPKLFQLIFLSAVFYFGIWVNTYLIGVEEKTKHAINLITLAALVVLFVVEMISAYIKTEHKTYNFFSNRVEYGRKIVFYGNIQRIYFKRNVLDKIFNTGTIVLSPYLELKRAKDINQIYFNAQKIVQGMQAGMGY